MAARMFSRRPKMVRVLARMPVAAKPEASGLAQLRTVDLTVWLMASVAGRAAAPHSQSTVELSHHGRATSGACLASSPGRSGGGTGLLMGTAPMIALLRTAAQRADASCAATSPTLVYFIRACD